MAGAAVGVIAVAVVGAVGLAPNSVPPPNRSPSGGFAASVVFVVVVGVVVLVPAGPAAGAALAPPSPKPVPGAVLGLAPPKSPPKVGAAVVVVLVGVAEVVVVGASVFGAKRFNPVVAGAVVNVGVDPVPIDGAAVVPVPVVIDPGIFNPPNRLDPLVVPELGAAVVAEPPARAAVADMDRQRGLKGTPAYNGKLLTPGFRPTKETKVARSCVHVGAGGKRRAKWSSTSGPCGSCRTWVRSTIQISEHSSTSRARLDSK